MPTLTDTAGKLIPDAPRPPRRASAPDTSFSRTLSRERRVASEAPPPEPDARASTRRAARPSEPDRSEALAPAPAVDPGAPEPEGSAAQSTDAEAQGLQDRQASTPGSGRASAGESPKSPREVSEGQAPSGLIVGGPEVGQGNLADGPPAPAQQPPAPAGPPAQTAATTRAPAGPGLPSDAPLAAGETPAAVTAAAPPDGAANTGGDQTGRAGHGPSGTGDGNAGQKAGTGDATGASKSDQGTGEPSSPHNPAVGRAVQVQAAVQVENITGHAPIPASTAAGAVATGAEGQALSSSDAAPGAPAHHFAGHVVRGLSAMIGQRGGVMTMRLQPPELGQLRVQMTIMRGAVTAQFQPATAEAQTLLDRSLSTLRTALESHGLLVDRLTVHPPTQHAGPNARDAGEEQTQQQRNHADAGHGQSRGRRDGQGEHAPQRFAPGADQEFEVSRFAAATAGGEP